MSEINYGSFRIIKDQEVYVKHCNFNLAILWITKELSIPLTIFEDIKKRGVKKLIFVNTNPEGELVGVRWEFETNWLDINKREKKMFQETQYYFPISDKLPKKVNTTEKEVLEAMKDIKPEEVIIFDEAQQPKSKSVNRKLK